MNTHFVSSTSSTSGCCVMGVFECPAVGSSAFSSPLVELTTCGREGKTQGGSTHTSTHRRREREMVCHVVVWFTVNRGGGG